MTDKQWDTIMNLHTKAPFQVVRAAAPYFRVKDGEPRSIINVSSVSGLHGSAYVFDQPCSPFAAFSEVEETDCGG
jgi:NAD(P)-dependent dehydrogenase (short-subunit alcohol dehydrogenase family)